MTHYDKEREVDELWRNAPEGSEFYGRNSRSFYKIIDGDVMFFDRGSGFWERSIRTSSGLIGDKDTVVRPQHTSKQPEAAQDAIKPRSAYQRTIIGLDGSKCVVDVYRVLDAFKTDSPALDHAVKKILCPGTRHAKTRKQDLKEAIKSIEAELLLMEQRNGM